MRPTMGRHQVIVVEDADRITERGADALLKAIEEPAPRTVWVLCAPTLDDVVATIRSRCRHLHLATPSEAAVASCSSPATVSILRWRRSPRAPLRDTWVGPERWP